MQNLKPILVILFVILAFSLLFASIRQTTIADETAAGLLPAEQVKTAPDFALPNAATGQVVHLQEQAKSQLIVLDFWATWCGPCRAELPGIQALSQKYAGRVTFYGINSSDPPKVVTTFAEHNKLTFPMLSDLTHDAAFHYGADAIPLVVVVDKHGKARAVSQGYGGDVEPNLSKVLDTLLSE